MTNRRRIGWALAWMWVLVFHAYYVWRAAADENVVKLADLCRRFSNFR